MTKKSGLMSLTIIIVLIFMFQTVVAQDDLQLLTFDYDGEARSYRLYVPDETEPSANLPVAVILHGGGGNSRAMARYTDFHLSAPDWMVVYPDGLKNQWHDGRDIENPPWDIAPDDSGFLAALVTHLIETQPVDRDRVIAAGLSNGGHMSIRLGCEHSDLFSGIVAVTASLPENLVCEPQAPLSVIIMNGTEDPLLPYEGGEVGNGRGVDLSTDETVAFWVEHNECEASPEIESIDDVENDGTRIEISRYSVCDGAFVALYRIEGGGHTWAGANQYLPVGMIGRTSREINASDEIVTEFTRYFRNT